MLSWGPGSGRRKGERDGEAEKRNRALPHISSLAAGLCFTPTSGDGLPGVVNTRGKHPRRPRPRRRPKIVR